MVAVVDPVLGPGSFRDPSFQLGIQSLQNAGIPVLGYIATDYANVNLQTIETLISNYKNWYHVNGTVLDQLNNTVGEEGYYSALTNFDRSLGMTMTVGNPGTEVPASFVGTVDTNVIYESPGVPSLSFIGGWHASYPKSNWIITAYGVENLDVTWLRSASQYLGYVYITDGVWPNPYTGLPGYMNTLMSTLASVNG
jgi:Spherulation-specific family 4